MPLVTTMLYVQSLLVGLTPPGDTGLRGPISALITPFDPDQNPLGVARVYVWPSRNRESRIAVPRNTGKNTPAGWKEKQYNLDVVMTWVDDPNDPNPDVNFPLLIDWVEDTLRTSPNAAQFTDPYTGRVSNFSNVGEVMSGEYPLPVTLEAMAQRRYGSRTQCSIQELFQA